MSTGARARLVLGTRPRQPKSSEIVARDLAAYIVDARLPEGTSLETENAVAKSMGVGRTTMREALRLLEARGVLTIRSGPGGGPVVRRPRPADLAEALTLLLQFEGASFSQVMSARSLLEPTVARAAAALMPAAALGELEEANAAMTVEPSDMEAFARGNRRFHALIAEHCGSIVLRIFCETLGVIGDGQAIGIRYSAREIQAIARAHERIIAALRAGDGDAAAGAMRTHLKEAQDYSDTRFAEHVFRTVRWVQ
ncbi:MAG TPA: FCD domain-containing protein [Baekduia sp.]|jgi:DNA-binding FadR family transcriptional regulator